MLALAAQLDRMLLLAFISESSEGSQTEMKLGQEAFTGECASRKRERTEKMPNTNKQTQTKRKMVKTKFYSAWNADTDRSY